MTKKLTQCKLNMKGHSGMEQDIENWGQRRGGKNSRAQSARKNFFAAASPTNPVCPLPTYWGHMTFLPFPVETKQ